jgi:hypothetical protein
MKSLPFFILEGDALGEGGTDELPDLLLARNSAQFSKGSFSEGYWCFRRCLGILGESQQSLYLRGLERNFISFSKAPF